MEHNTAPDCRLDQLSEYLDGALDAGTSNELRTHLDDCEGCREELKRLTWLHERLAEWETPGPSPFFVDRMMAQLVAPVNAVTPRPPPRHRAIEWLVKQLVPAALTTAAAAALFFLFLRAPTDVPEPVSLDGFLSRFVDQEIRPLVTIAESDLTHDDVFSMLFVAEGRR
jgi:anti-sigma factor RsiW